MYLSHLIAQDDFILATDNGPFNGDKQPVGLVTAATCVQRNSPRDILGLPSRGLLCADIVNLELSEGLILDVYGTIAAVVSKWFCKMSCHL